MKIKYNLFIFITLFGIIFAALPTYFFITTFINAQKDEIVSNLETAASNILDKFSAFMNERIANFEVISSPTHMLSNNNISLEQKVDFLRLLESSTKAYSSMSIYDKSGIKIGDTRSILIGLNESQKPFFKAAIQGDIYYDKSPVLSQSLQSYVIHISAPIYYNGQINGVVVGRISIDKMNQIIQQSHLIEKNADIDVWNKNKEKIYSNGNLQLTSQDIDEDYPLLQQLINSKEYIATSNLSEHSDITIATKEHNFLNYHGSELYLTINISKNDAFGQSTLLEQQLAIISTIIIIVAITIIFFYTKIITDTIEKLKNAAMEISKGNFNVKANIQSNDELGELSNAFNFMSKELGNYRDLVNEEEKTITSQLHEIQMSTTLLNNMKKALDESSLVAISDKNGIITYANKKFCDVSEYTEKEVIGQNYDIVKSGFHPPEFFDDMWTTISNGCIWKGDIKNVSKHGKYFLVHTVIVPIMSENGVLEQYISIMTDMTKQKDMQDNILKMEKLSAIGALSARIAHDMRNPISVINNALKLIKIGKPVLDEHTKKYLGIMDKATYRLVHQIEEVLDYVTPKPLNLQNSSLYEIVTSSLERHDIPEDIIINLPNNDVQLYCDPLKIEIVFTNLIANALQVIHDAGKAGRIDIRYTDEKDQVVIEVEDDGPGIPKHLLDKIFDPLFTTRQIGTGLGLTSCKSIIEKHGGTISVTSEPNKGARFIIKLPKNTGMKTK